MYNVKSTYRDRVENIIHKNMCMAVYLSVVYVCVQCMSPIVSCFNIMCHDNGMYNHPAPVAFVEQLWKLKGIGLENC